MRTIINSPSGYNGVWDANNMGKMWISEDKLTVTHGGDFLGSYQCVRGTSPITSGIGYWEVVIDKLRYVYFQSLFQRRHLTYHSCIVPIRLAFMSSLEWCRQTSISTILIYRVMEDGVIWQMAGKHTIAVWNRLLFFFKVIFEY